MRPQGFGQLGSGLEDLGWNDMGFEPPKPTLAPVRDADHDAFGDAIPAAPVRNPAAGLTPVSPVHVAHAEIAERLNGHGPEDENEAKAEDVIDDPRPELAESAEVVALPARPAAPRRAPRPRSEPGAKGKAAFTLRLDPDRHLKLRLACAVTARSAQQLVTRALDELLDSMPELDAMAQRAPERASKKG
nr:hypothetical protein [Sphingomonas arenae]